MSCLRLLLIFSLLASKLPAQMNTPLTQNSLRALAPRCAHMVHPDTIEALVHQESAYRPYALSINHPAHEAARQGYPGGLYELAHQPRTLRQAVTWTRWLLAHGYTVSLGLMQVNSQVAPALGIKDPLLLFDPCLNLAAGAAILRSAYVGQPHTLNGLANAFAIYNSGSIGVGTRNGYAAGVIAKAPPIAQSERGKR